MKIRHREPVGPRRKAEYLDIGDQLDAIYKLAKALEQQGIEMPDEVKEWIDRCSEVKRRFPK